MAKVFGLNHGAVVLGTDKGLLQIYIKSNKAIVTLESSRNLVTYAKGFDVRNVVSPFAQLVTRVLPNNLALQVVGSEFGKRDTIVLEDNNEKLTLNNNGIKKGSKTVKFTTYSNQKVLNLFEEQEKDPNIFSGFVNYKIDSLGNIDDRESDLLKRCFTPKYTLKDLAGDEKKKEALIKESATEKYLSKMYKEYLADHEDELDDIQRVGFKKIKNMFDEVNEALKESKGDNLIDALDRARASIIQRNGAIANILEYVNDSRIEGNYTSEQVSKELASIYVKEKLSLWKESSSVEEKFDKEKKDEKLQSILEEDIVDSYKKVKRVNYEDMLPIQFVRTKENIRDLSEPERAKIDSVLKRYVDLLESVDYLGTNTKSKPMEKDELGVIISNYDAYLEEGVLDRVGIEAGDGFARIFRNYIKTEIIKQKTGCDDVLTFEHQQKDDEGEVVSKSEYNYIAKGGTIYPLKDNQTLEPFEEEEILGKYERYVGEEEVEKSSLIRLANKTHFTFVAESDDIAQIGMDYQAKNIVNDTIYMLKTCEEEKEIRRSAYLKTIVTNLTQTDTQFTGLVDVDEIIYDKNPEKILETIEEVKDSIGYEDLELLSEDDLQAMEEIVEEETEAEEIPEVPEELEDE